MNYIICGSAPGFGGVPKLMEYLNDRLDHSKYVMVYPKIFNFKNRYLRWIVNKISKQIFFSLKLIGIKNKNIILMHHQSIGIRLTKYLIENNKNVDFYVMDNAFFCLKSYNYIEGQNKECLECIGGKFDNAFKNNCKAYPVKYEIRYNLAFLRYLRKQYKKINFFTLSDSNASLLKKHFGEDVCVKVVYLLTNDILSYQQNLKLPKKNVKHYDIVFHANDLEAKGFIYMQELAKELDQYTIFIPTSKKVKNKKGNISTNFITWETGLKEVVMNAKLVLTLSFWSNTPEAATLKSLIYNGSVGLIKNQYGFANDIDHMAYLQLSGDKNIDAKKIDNFLKKKKYIQLRIYSKIYLEKYFEKAQKSMHKFFKINSFKY